MELIIALIGNIIGFAFFALIVYLIIRSVKKHPETFALEENEQLVELSHANYWKIEFLISNKPIPGELAFTNKRLIFKEMSLIPTVDDISVPYSEILEIRKSFIMFFPMGITVITKNKNSYKFGIMKRNHYIDLINSLAQNTQ